MQTPIPVPNKTKMATDIPQAIYGAGAHTITKEQMEPPRVGRRAHLRRFGKTKGP